MSKSAVAQYAADHSTPEPALLQELAQYTHVHMSGAQMLCGSVVGRLLQWLVGLLPAQRVLELGTYTGYSALFMAEALLDKGQLVTCDKNPHALAVARQFVARSAHGHKIRLVQQEIGDFLQELVGVQAWFDFIFIDANKKSNKQYLELCLQLLTPNGMIAVDNTLFREQVIHPQDELSQVIAAFNAELAQRADLQVLLLPVRDGITLIRRS